VPACHRCNSSKGSQDAHQWFSSQIFYSQSQWDRIQSLLRKSRPTTTQLPLLPPA
jgi:hypothetical protein